jgi:uncharacterized protein YjbK
MHSNIEIEAKVLLQKEQYDQVVSYLHLERYKKIKQTNHYIDSTSRVLRDNDFALRVREKDDFVLTLKTPLSEGLLEKNQTLSWREYDALEDESIFPIGNIKSFLELCGFNTRELQVLASLTTYRIEFEYEDGLVSLDENHYGKNGKVVDYELEIESASMERAEELVKRLLQEAGITEFKFNTLSKQARALEASL